MREKLIPWMRCPNCPGDLLLKAASKRHEDDIIEGCLRCRNCTREYPIQKRIPIFVERSSYTDSFGWQWKRFNKLQRDSYNGTQIVRNTILKRSGWSPGDLADRSVLECGCGPGNDTEVLVTLARTVVSLDMSSAVDSQPPELLARDNALVIRADLNAIPLKPSSFDIVYCHRVIQHTPDPRKSFASMARHVRPGGTFFLHSYDTHWKSLLHYRHWARPLVRRLRYETVFRILTTVAPVLYPLVGALRRIAFLRHPVKMLVPFENHDRTLAKNNSTLSRGERYEYSLLTTFDALTARYDNPNSPKTICRWFEEEGFESLEVRGRSPAIVVGTKPPFAKSVDLHPAQVGLA